MKSIPVFFLVILIAAALSAQTNIPAGPVQGVWNSGGSPYLVMGDISITNGTELTIEPGVDIIFQGDYSLFVYGTVSAIGSEAFPITFTAQDTLIGWASIRFTNTGAGFIPPSSFTHVKFLYGHALGGTGGSDPLNYGGAVWGNNAGTLTFDHCLFNRCISGYDGSAIFADNGTNLAMTNCTIKNCESGFFGGVYVREGTAEITDCIFDSNTAVTFGAALYFYDCTLARITSCTISNNTAGAVTGIYAASSALQIRNSLFAGNNTTMGLGAGMGIIGGSVSIINSTFHGNVSAQGGAAAWFNVLPEPALITNCIFWENQPNALAATSSTYSLAYCSTQTAEGDATNIFGDPQFTDPAQGILTLMETSPCIDAGTPDAGGLGLPLLDLGGLPRIVDGDADGTPRIDMGCYEWQVPVLDGVLSGVVLYQSMPVEGALITADGSSVLSGPSGTYSLSLPAGTYTVSCSKDGYVTAIENGVVIEAGNMTTLNFQLMEVSNSDDCAPGVPYLSQNHPNPFTGKTSIAYSLDSAGWSRLEIFNCKGQKVKTIFSGQAASGDHLADWDGMDTDGHPVESGIYFYRLSTPSVNQTRKMVIIR
jgi:hypothetical protein